jgi:hypothetical protein
MWLHTLNVQWNRPRVGPRIGSRVGPRIESRVGPRIESRVRPSYGS